MKYIKINQKILFLKKNFSDFQIIKKGELIATDGTEKIIAKKEGIIAFAYGVEVPRNERFCLGT